MESMSLAFLAISLFTAVPTAFLIILHVKTAAGR
uniref:Photosystem II protein M n=1 Tax=Selaginella sanguinolenta TaxID=493175 RepID=A0A482CJP3_9TRAC|nr:photosystem II protein M [Selaginella sanguinolenta]YP_009589794.1 photosystem II protein M [Selaginella sanguinolenta]QBL76373.1 photosystem II protein M [Selaginella sanguinolenta]QBL76374.1 photosystem II protein M [Selaginella sanguinolenta]